MHHKAIKYEIRKQLKIQHPNWHCLSNKEKKSIAKKVLEESVNNYDFKQGVTTPLEVLLGIESQLPTASIMNLDEMERFIENCKNSVLFKLNCKIRLILQSGPWPPVSSVVKDQPTGPGFLRWTKLNWIQSKLSEFLVNRWALEWKKESWSLDFPALLAHRY